MNQRRTWLGLGLLGLAATLAWQLWPAAKPAPWNAAERALLASLSLDQLPAQAVAPGNAVAANAGAVELGRRLFFDPRLSANGQIACSTCHQPALAFTDGLDKGRGLGESRRNTRSLIGATTSPWLYWDGRKDSLWSQALSPLEDPAEHGGNRMAYARFITSDPGYAAAYRAVFGSLPDFSDPARFPEAAAPGPDRKLARAWEAMSAADRFQVNRVFSNIGKAIAAFEHQIKPGRARFDDYVAAVLDGNEVRPDQILSAAEIRGLRLFIGKARCIECHNGPMFTNQEFHNTGVLSYPGDLPDRGRAEALQQVRDDPFNCLGEFSDASPDACAELRFARDDASLLGATRTPSLRHVAATAPYMHRGQLKTLGDVISHYNRALPAMIGHNEAKPPGLDRRERQDLTEFLESLSAAPEFPGATAP